MENVGTGNRWEKAQKFALASACSGPHPTDGQLPKIPHAKAHGQHIMVRSWGMKSLLFIKYKAQKVLKDDARKMQIPPTGTTVKSQTQVLHKGHDCRQSTGL